MSSGSRSRSRSPMDRKIRTIRHSYRDEPYRRDRQGFSQNNLCKNCKRPGHFARECPNVAICHNCGFPGSVLIATSKMYTRHIASECTTQSLCWNCREPGHTAGNCPNEGICHTCGKAGHRARDCTTPQLPPGDLRLCNNCFKQGHIAADCTNDKACKNCRKTGHLARDCQNEPVCNMCNISGHVARECTKAGVIEERGGGARGGGGYRDVICRTCHQPGHISRDCMVTLMTCHNCGGRGHHAYECPSGRFLDRFPRRY
ncbi:zinc knuckle (CCHC-type) family protein [Actinidia rufa]|uniref:Zinc knuckle (CCHC-type) family protein n=1 Tax=Actinidia rufa TaxID=165716 RepID=A0A7J0ETL4_9ERIC|nr:zinc knuckle (CCHC-type) family protein [Actinidia rufa]